MNVSSCCVMVLNYNGMEHLDDCLSSAVEAAERSSVDCRVVMVDNRSTDESVDHVRRNFPTVEVVIAEKNDILFSLNPIVRNRTEDVVIILNNDMRFDPGFIDPLLEHFDRPDIFSVMGQVLSWDGVRLTTNVRHAGLRRFWCYKCWSDDGETAQFTVEAGGGSSAYHRQRFAQLGGFDRMYHPGYCEDTDLTWRAWEHGLVSIYEPRSILYHKVGATLSNSLGARRRSIVCSRNHILFTLKNIGGPAFAAFFLLLLPLRALRPLLRGDTIPLRAVRAAIPRLGKALAGRRAKPHALLDTDEILKRVKSTRPAGTASVAHARR